MEHSRYRVTLPAMRALLVAAFLLVLAVGVSLFLLTERTDEFFAWTIPSFITAAFFGASYWAAGVLELFAARERMWANSRIAVPAVFVFSTLTLIVTLLHLDRFHFAAPAWFTVAGTWVWLGIYVIVPIAMAVLWIAQLRVAGADPPRGRAMPSWLRGVLAVASALLFILGAALLIAPTAVLPAWPWPLTALTARATGAWLIGWGVVTGQTAWENDMARVRPAFISLLALGALQSLVLARYANEVRWASPGAWIYALAIATALAIGIYGTWTTRGPRPDRDAPARG